MQETENSNSFTFRPTLFIRSTSDGFIFHVSTKKGEVDKELNLLAPYDFPDRFEEFIQINGWAGKENLRVSLIYFSDHFMLLPNGISEEEHVKTFFDFQFTHEEENQIFTTPLSDGKQLFCWEIPTYRNRCFEKLFPRLTILPSAFILSDWAINQSALQHHSLIIGHLCGKSMHILAADNENLLFANTFPIGNNEEMPYFFLRCMDQLLFNPLFTRCVLCSETIPENQLREIFRPYIKRIEIGAFTLNFEEPFQII